METTASSSEVKPFRLYINGLPENISESDLIPRFTSFGKVSKVEIARKDPYAHEPIPPNYIPMKGSARPCRGFAHLTLTCTEEQLNTCLTSYQGTKWKGKEFIVQKARLSRLQVGELERERIKVAEEAYEAEYAAVDPSTSIPEFTRSHFTLKLPFVPANMQVPIGQSRHSIHLSASALAKATGPAPYTTNWSMETAPYHPPSHVPKFRRCEASSVEQGLAAAVAAGLTQMTAADKATSLNAARALRAQEKKVKMSRKQREAMLISGIGPDVVEAARVAAMNEVARTRALRLSRFLARKRAGDDYDFPVADEEMEMFLDDTKGSTAPSLGGFSGADIGEEEEVTKRGHESSESNTSESSSSESSSDSTSDDDADDDSDDIDALLAAKLADDDMPMDDYDDAFGFPDATIDNMVDDKIEDEKDEIEEVGASKDDSEDTQQDNDNKAEIEIDLKRNESKVPQTTNAVKPKTTEEPSQRIGDVRSKAESGNKILSAETQQRLRMKLMADDDDKDDDEDEKHHGTGLMDADEQMRAFMRLAAKGDDEFYGSQLQAQGGKKGNTSSMIARLSARAAMKKGEDEGSHVGEGKPDGWKGRMNTENGDDDDELEVVAVNNVEDDAIQPVLSKLTGEGSLHKGQVQDQADKMSKAENKKMKKKGKENSAVAKVTSTNATLISVGADADDDDDDEASIAQLKAKFGMATPTIQASTTIATPTTKPMGDTSIKHKAGRTQAVKNDKGTKEQGETGTKSGVEKTKPQESKKVKGTGLQSTTPTASSSAPSTATPTATITVSQTAMSDNGVTTSKTTLGKRGRVDEGQIPMEGDHTKEIEGPSMKKRKVDNTVTSVSSDTISSGTPVKTPCQSSSVSSSYTLSPLSSSVDTPGTFSFNFSLSTSVSASTPSSTASFTSHSATITTTSSSSPSSSTLSSPPSTSTTTNPRPSQPTSGNQPRLRSLFRVFSEADIPVDAFSVSSIASLPGVVGVISRNAHKALRKEKLNAHDLIIKGDIANMTSDSNPSSSTTDATANTSIIPSSVADNAATQPRSMASNGLPQRHKHENPSTPSTQAIVSKPASATSSTTSSPPSPSPSATSSLSSSSSSPSSSSSSSEFRLGSLFDSLFGLNDSNDPAINEDTSLPSALTSAPPTLFGKPKEISSAISASNATTTTGKEDKTGKQSSEMKAAVPAKQSNPQPTLSKSKPMLNLLAKASSSMSTSSSSSALGRGLPIKLDLSFGASTKPSPTAGNNTSRTGNSASNTNNNTMTSADNDAWKTARTQHMEEIRKRVKAASKKTEGKR